MARFRQRGAASFHMPSTQVLGRLLKGTIRATHAGARPLGGVAAKRRGQAPGGACRMMRVVVAIRH
eukprot:12531882-Alexandrium_andersonii.AAC.1